MLKFLSGNIFFQGKKFVDQSSYLYCIHGENHVQLLIKENRARYSMPHMLLPYTWATMHNLSINAIDKIS